MFNSFSRRAAAAFSALIVGSIALAGAQAQTPKPSPTPKMAPKMASKMTPKSGRKMPMRDPKTGRFVKASPSPKPSPTPGAMRDPKTGRFMKKGQATPTPDRVPKPGV